MRYVNILIFLIVFALPACCQDFRGVKYIKNYDGDTYTFDLGEGVPELFRTMPLRLYGIDTPEMRAKNPQEKEKAVQAKNFGQSELVGAKQIDLVNCKDDKYFRILCSVNYDGKDLTGELLKRNMGYPYYGGKKESF